MKKSCVTGSRGIFVALFPALLLSPFLHLHPVSTHVHGTHVAHQHAAVAHADFLVPLAHDHDEHHGGHTAPDDTSSPTQIGFSTLPPRHLTLFLPPAESVLVAVAVNTSALSSPFAAHAWLLARDHAPPVRAVLFSPSIPRSPPHCA